MKNLKYIYISGLVISLLSLSVAFIFRYSYIDILGFDRPLKLACMLSALLGTIGSILAIIDGVNKHFEGHVLTFAILNLLLVFSYPILLTVEDSIKTIENPYEDKAPDKGYSTNYKKDSSFIVEGEIYKFPVCLKDFKDNGFSYSIDKKENKAIIKREGDSNKKRPTWFTDGERNNVYKEFYLLEAYYQNPIDDGILDEPIDLLKASVINNNRDFEVKGISLEDSIYKIKEKFKDELKEDPDNKNTPSKAYYLKTSDGYEIRLKALQGNVQSIEIYNPSIKDL